MIRLASFFLFFFFNDTATTEIYTLSLHDALPISLFSGALDLKHLNHRSGPLNNNLHNFLIYLLGVVGRFLQEYLLSDRSEEHTSELQSPCNLVCRLLLEKKKKTLICCLISSNYAS